LNLTAIVSSWISKRGHAIPDIHINILFCSLHAPSSHSYCTCTSGVDSSSYCIAFCFVFREILDVEDEELGEEELVFFFLVLGFFGTFGRSEGGMSLNTLGIV